MSEYLHLEQTRQIFILTSHRHLSIMNGPYILHVKISYNVSRSTIYHSIRSLIDLEWYANHEITSGTIRIAGSIRCESANNVRNEKIKWCVIEKNGDDAMLVEKSVVCWYFLIVLWNCMICYKKRIIVRFQIFSFHTIWCSLSRISEEKVNCSFPYKVVSET